MKNLRWQRATPYNRGLKSRLSEHSHKSIIFSMSRRIHIVLPDNTMPALDRVKTPGTRSRFIDRAVRHLIDIEGKMNLRERLKREAIANAERDLTIAAEWFPLEEEAAQRTESGRETKRSRRRS